MQIKQRLIDYYQTPSGKVPAREWLSSLKDKVTQAILYKRIRQAGLGQFGKTRDELILLLMAGSKPTQSADIKKAHAYWIEWKEREI